MARYLREEFYEEGTGKAKALCLEEKECGRGGRKQGQEGNGADDAMHQ